MTLTAVIPALNAADHLPACLLALGDTPAVVCDGHSADNTPLVARALGATSIRAARGRGNQMAAAADHALMQGADALLLLHADTLLSANWQTAADAFLCNPANRGKAGWFRLAFDDTTPQARRVARLANWRARALGLPYGDQGLILSAETYRAAGGIRPLPLMEDVDLVRRLGRQNLVELPAVATTSADRYRRGGWWLRPMRNIGYLTLFLLGVSPATLARMYTK